MTPFTVLAGRAVALRRAQLDTDQIIPARFLRKPRGNGYGGFLFHDVAAAEAGFPVRPGAGEILLAGANFGCGSSREGAVYALVDAGFRCVVAPSFGDIFAANAAKNGLLTVALAEAAEVPDGPITVDLPAQRIRAADGREWEFEIDPFRKTCLLEGLDDIGLTLRHADALAAFAAARPRWTQPGDGG
ncbi:MAG: 3-isopropylmalate dehydratase small subunit [Rhodospirillales bacterium]|nr:3-isopropylmalate dehydratase small subunit [Rhodospirillales bacterium]